MHSVIKIKQLSMESTNDGKSRKEIELVLVGRIDDFSKLFNLGLDKESQEQYTIKRTNGEIRVRKTDDEYILTTKTWEAGVLGKDEAETNCSEDQFKHFRKLCDSGMIKDRYLYPLNQFKGAWLEIDPSAPYEGALVLQIDVFKNKQGQIQPYVKIDLEFPNTFTLTPDEMLQLVPDIGFTDVITNQWNKRTAEESIRMTDIYENYFTVK